MADHDLKQDLATRELEASIANRVVYSTATGESAQDCIECGDGISSERQLAVPGCQMCTDCASASELKARHRR